MIVQLVSRGKGNPGIRFSPDVWEVVVNHISAISIAFPCA